MSTTNGSAASHSDDHALAAKMAATSVSSSGDASASASAPSSSSSSVGAASNGLPDADTVARHRAEWYIPASMSSQRTLNPIRAIVDRLVIPTNTGGKNLIPLSIGDPTVFGNLQPPPTAITALQRLVAEGKSNGYAPSTGTVAARTAIATRFGSSGPHPLTPNDVMICSGASGALHIAMDAMLDAGDNILLPKPGFSLYATIAGYLNVEVRYYNLLPERGWECDLDQMATLVDGRTRALLINNPSNPNGSNFTRAHLQQLVAFASRHRLPIISDEIYGDMVFAGHTFTPIADLSEDVPVVTASGLAKQYLVPGWRIGWLLFHDRQGKLAAAKAAALALTQIILGANTLCQALVPTLLLETPLDYYSALNQTLEDQSLFLYESIRAIPGLRPIEPQACMYLMVAIDTARYPAFADDVAFSGALLQEEMLFVLPGSCFMADNYFRLVTCAPRAVLEQAMARLRRFCATHFVPAEAEAAPATDKQ